MSSVSTSVALCWFRRDLRLEDNAAFYYALKSGLPVVPVFVFDRTILDKLEDRDDARVSFIWQIIIELNSQLAQHGSTMDVFYGTSTEAHKHWASKYQVKAVYTNRDYELTAIRRDQEIEQFWANMGAQWFDYKDQCIFDRQEVLSNTGNPYSVFTPYSRKWKDKLNDYYLKSYPSDQLLGNLFKQPALSIPSLDEMGFRPTSIDLPPSTVSDKLLDEYAEMRNYPGVRSTSRLGLHLRFGTISIRALARKAQQHSEVFLNELIWRDFYFSILANYPHVGEGKAFKAAYDKIVWRNNPDEFAAWCEGRTGYPIVDAGMRELNATGFMHNRVRMIVASFLCKHLLIDWRWGEAYFARKLLDFDFSANNGGWQWASGSGCDAAPYFRVFNPTLQTEKFDKQFKYIRQWVPEFNDPFKYPKPIVVHDFARKRCLDTYAVALKGVEVAE